MLLLGMSKKELFIDYSNYHNNYFNAYQRNINYNNLNYTIKPSKFPKSTLQWTYLDRINEAGRNIDKPQYGSSITDNMKNNYMKVKDLGKSTTCCNLIYSKNLCQQKGFGKDFCFNVTENEYCPQFNTKTTESKINPCAIGNCLYSMV